MFFQQKYMNHKRKLNPQVLKACAEYAYGFMLLLQQNIMCVSHRNKHAHFMNNATNKTGKTDTRSCRQMRQKLPPGNRDRNEELPIFEWHHVWFWKAFILLETGWQPHTSCKVGTSFAQ